MRGLKDILSGLFGIIVAFAIFASAVIVYSFLNKYNLYNASSSEAVGVFDFLLYHFNLVG